MRCWRPSKFFLCGVLWVASAFSEMDLVDRIVAVVKDEPILYSELQEAKSFVLAEFKRTGKESDFGTPKEQDRKVLEQLINDKLISQEIKRLGMNVDEAAVDSGIKSLMQQNGMQSIEQLQGALRSEGIGWGEFRENVKRQLEQSSFLNRFVRSKVRIDPEDVNRAYKEAYPEGFISEKYHVRMIFMNKPGATQESMSKILKQVRSSKSFETVAKKVTEGPSKEEGGDIGYVEPGDLQKELGEALLKMKAGDISGVIESGQGFYILQLVDKKQEAGSNAQAKKEEIREKLYNEETNRIFESTVRSLREKGNIQTYL